VQVDNQYIAPKECCRCHSRYCW